MNILEVNNTIFSDEGSKDSMGYDMALPEQVEQVWENVEEHAKASLVIMKNLTKKMENGDETDRAIHKVLTNLVTTYLKNFNPNADLDTNLTYDQKLEQENQHLIYELATCLPFVKLAPGSYLVGTEIRSIQIKGRGVLVRTGGGYMYLSEFMLHYAKSECLKMGLMIIKQQSNYRKITINLLKKHPNTASAQKDFIRKCPDGIDEQF